ncbi:MAG TPA: preprotein translocase subunit SecE [Clostridia bacterium]|nr:preprotein translocase subunit SecE [Clostridia bacterium]
MTENARTSKLAAFGKRIVKFTKDIRTELKKVIWPTRAQLINNTVSVLGICLVIGVVIWASDTVLGKVIEWTLNR